MAQDCVLVSGTVQGGTCFYLTPETRHRSLYHIASLNHSANIYCVWSVPNCAPGIENSAVDKREDIPALTEPILKETD